MIQSRLTMHAGGAALLTLHAIEAIGAGLGAVLARPAGRADAVAGLRVAGGVVQASANLITIFTIVTARTVRLAMNALGSHSQFRALSNKQTSAKRETQIKIKTNECVRE